MDVEPGAVESGQTHEQLMESYARRSAESLETIQSGFMLLLALVILSLLIGAAVFLSS